MVRQGRKGRSACCRSLALLMAPASAKDWEDPAFPPGGVLVLPGQTGLPPV